MKWMLLWRTQHSAWCEIVGRAGVCCCEYLGEADAGSSVAYIGLQYAHSPSASHAKYSLLCTSHHKYVRIFQLKIPRNSEIVWNIYISVWI